MVERGIYFRSYSNKANIKHVFWTRDASVDGQFYTRFLYRGKGAFLPQVMHCIFVDLHVLSPYMRKTNLVIL